MPGRLVRMIAVLFAVSFSLAAFGSCPALARIAPMAAAAQTGHHDDGHDAGSSHQKPGQESPANHCAYDLSLAGAVGVEPVRAMAFKVPAIIPFTAIAMHTVSSPEMPSSVERPQTRSPPGSYCRGVFARTGRMHL